MSWEQGRARESDLDPHVAYAALYDAARKAVVALLQVQGLRPTRAGGHMAGIEAVRAQLDPPLGAILKPLDRMRRTRHAAEYPSSVTLLTATSVQADLSKSREIVDLAERLLPELTIFAR